MVTKKEAVDELPLPEPAAPEPAAALAPTPPPTRRQLADAMLLLALALQSALDQALIQDNVSKLRVRAALGILGD